MIDKQQASVLAQNAVDSQSKRTKDIEFVMLEKATVEEDFGWIFFYQSKKFLETGNLMDAIAGGGPIIVDKFSEAVIQTGSRLDVEDYIKLYQKYREDLALFYKACNTYIHGNEI